jgi:hypothetical protein
MTAFASRQQRRRGAPAATIDLHIDTLALHGTARADASTLSAALADELSRLARVPAALAPLRAESVAAARYADGAPEATGRAVAAVLWAALPARGRSR